MAITDLTVKKNDDTTDILWSAISASPGDGSPAVWKSKTVGAAPAHQPEIRLMSKEGSNGKTRVQRITAFYPQIAVNTTTGITSIINVARATFELSADKSMPSSDVNEFVSQLFNIFDHATFKGYVKTMYPAS